MVMFVSIVDLVRKLGKKTIAEGVETEGTVTVFKTGWL